VCFFLRQPHLPANQRQDAPFGWIFPVTGDQLEMDHRSILAHDHLRELIPCRLHGIDERSVTLGDANNEVADMQFSATGRGPSWENSD
jgi:hypothetical protein